MTGMPEAALARELDVAYATLGVVANAAAGQGESAQHISMQDIEAVVAQAMQRVGRVLERVVQA
jgi:purine nucleoside phosphorylase